MVEQAKDCWDIAPLRWSTVPTPNEDGLEWTVLDADGNVLEEDWPPYLRQLVLLRDQIDPPRKEAVCVWCQRPAQGLYVDAEHQTVDPMCTDCGKAREAKLKEGG